MADCERQHAHTSCRWQPFLNASSQEIQFQNTLKAANCTTLHCLRGLPEASLAVINQRVQNMSYAAGSPGTGE